VSSIQTARPLRRDQTGEEKDLWRALRSHRFAGFKFRRQHPAGIYILDFYCAAARLDVELDGFQHGVPEQIQHDEVRSAFLKEQDIEELRFWNHEWQKNRKGCLLATWDALQRRTGCGQVINAEEQQFVPSNKKLLKRPTETNPSRPSPRLAGRGR
jgi:very-short-patch-repair endonuclease